MSTFPYVRTAFVVTANGVRTAKVGRHTEDITEDTKQYIFDPNYEADDDQILLKYFMSPLFWSYEEAQKAWWEEMTRRLTDLDEKRAYELKVLQREALRSYDNCPSIYDIDANEVDG